MKVLVNYLEAGNLGSCIRALHFGPRSLHFCVLAHDHKIRKIHYRNSSIINNLLDIEAWSAAVYFYSSFVFWLVLGARQNTTRLVKIYSRTARLNV